MNTTSISTGGAVIPTAGADALTFSEATVQDLRLAEALGYERPTDIRPLIKRQAEALEAMGVLRMVRKTSGANGGRPTTEYHLSKAQAAFIIAKAKTKRAESLAILMAEVFAMFTEGQLVPVDDRAAKALQAAEEREGERRGLIHEEEKEARHQTLKDMNRRRRPRKNFRPKLTRWDREVDGG